MKKTVLIAVILQSLVYSSYFDKTTLNEYISFVSKHYNKTILLASDVNPKLNLYISDNINKNSYLKILKTALKDFDLQLLQTNDYFYITSTTDLKDRDLYKIKLDYLSKNDLKDYLNIYADINYSISPTTNYLYLKTSLNNFLSIKKHIKKIDVPPKQVKIKLNIFEIDVNKIKDNKINILASLEKLSIWGGNLLLDIVSSPFEANTNANSNNVLASLKFLNENGFTKILSSPTLTLRNHKSTVFSVVTNIPFLVESTQTTNEQVTANNTFDYKDVGLKIKIDTKIFDDYLDLNLNLIDQNILDSSTDTPVTTSKNLHQQFILKKDEVFFLVGFNKKQNIYKDDKSFFSFFGKSKTYNNKNLIITISVINDEIQQTMLTPLEIQNMDLFSKTINN